MTEDHYTWTVCPRCWARNTEQIEQWERKWIAGGMTEEHVSKLRHSRDVEESENERPFRTLHEQWEAIGVDRDGTFCIEYEAKCEVCGLHCVFVHSSPLSAVTVAS